jgi:hypothetical protein
MDNMEYASELYHYGIIGQKWGIRRYQNPDGSLTQAGRERYAKEFIKKYNDRENDPTGGWWKASDGVTVGKLISDKQYQDIRKANFEVEFSRQKLKEAEKQLLESKEWEDAVNKDYSRGLERLKKDDPDFYETYKNVLPKKYAADGKFIEDDTPFAIALEYSDTNYSGKMLREKLDKYSVEFQEALGNRSKVTSEAVNDILRSIGNKSILSLKKDVSWRDRVSLHQLLNEYSTITW